MKIIRVSKTAVMANMKQAPYGRCYLVISPESGEYHFDWIPDEKSKRPGAPDEYAAHIPQGLYEDEQIAIAHSIIDEEDVWSFIEHDIDATDSLGSGMDCVTYARVAYPYEWQQQVETAVSQTADLFLETLNNPLIDHPWGYAKVGNVYVPVVPPFQVAWVDPNLD